MQDLLGGDSWEKSDLDRIVGVELRENETTDEVLECACRASEISIYIAQKCKKLIATDLATITVSSAVLGEILGLRFFSDRS